MAASIIVADLVNPRDRSLQQQQVLTQTAELAMVILSPFRNKFGPRHESHEQAQVITNTQTADSVSTPSLKNITNLGAILWARLSHQKQQFGLKTPDRACTFYR
jgi:hypothetical protein